MKLKSPRVIYWDSSAVLSILLQDDHSEQALRYAGLDVIHLISSLAVAETHAVLNRLKRERLLADILIEAALEALETGPWRQLKIGPSAAETKKMAQKWPLRGADLWHLATAKTLQFELPELLILTFDKRLYSAASGEDLVLEIN
jgi:predicted nucleic acid-binding protein